MMTARLLTDQPLWAASHLHPTPAGPFQLGDPAARASAAVKALFGGVRTPLMEAPLPEGFPPWPLLMRREAPRSQFDVLLDLARHPPSQSRSPPQPHGESLPLPPVLVAVAGAGSRFHGSGGRPWVALEGNLHVCVALTLDPPRALPLPLLTPVVVNAMAGAVEDLPEFGGRVGIKWVNDLLVSGQKVGGALAATLMQGGQVGSVVLGFGLNVAQTPQVERSLHDPPVGSLHALAGPGGAPKVHTGPLLASILGRLAVTLAALTDDPERAARDILAQYRHRSVILGKEVEVLQDVTSEAAGAGGGGAAKAAAADLRPVRGRVLAIGPGLELSLEGHPEPITRGRLSWALGGPHG
jgi:biotin-(acetyl-CoA carboxylase) ligase